MKTRQNPAQPSHAIARLIVALGDQYDAWWTKAVQQSDLRLPRVLAASAVRPGPRMKQEVRAFAVRLVSHILD